MIYGTPSITIEDDQTDIVGLRTLVLSQMWQPSDWPLSIEQLDAEGPDIPDVGGGMGLVGKQMRRQNGALRTFWHFEGINGDGKSITFATRGNSLHYGFEPGFAEVTLRVHPRITQLMEKYDGEDIDNQIIWPRFIAGGQAQAGLSGGSTSQGNVQNPMWGRETYFALQGGTYWYRYMVDDEGQIPSIEGQLFSPEALPGRARNLPTRNYLGVGAQYQRRGPVAIEVVEQYWLSVEGGWSQEIYGKVAQRSAGLQTGSLTTGHL